MAVDGEEGQSQMPYNELCEWCVGRFIIIVNRTLNVTKLMSIGEMEPVFSDRDVIYVQTAHYVHTLCIQTKRWQAAAMYGETILPAFR